MGGALAVILASTTALATLHALDARAHKRRERLRMLARMWEHPERAARAAPPIGPAIARALVLGILTTAVVTPMRRFVMSLFEAHD
jgi:hypothetical protein